MFSQFIKKNLFHLGSILLVVVLAGCSGTLAPRPDVHAAAARATGIDNAITFHDVDEIEAAASSPAMLTMTEAVQQALLSDPDIQAVLARVRVAEADADQASLLPNPILSVVFRFPENSGKPIIEAGLAADFVAILQRPGRIEAADSRLRAAAAESLVIVLDLVAAVQEKYVVVQSLDALVPVLEERRKLLDRLFKLAEDRLKQGEGTSLDVTTLDTQRLELEVEMAEKRLERKQQRLGLARLLGRPEADANWELIPWHEPSQIRTAQASWIAAALENRPEISAQRWELAATGVEVRLTRFAPFEGADAGVASERDSVWTVGPSITTPLPIFDWGQAKRAKAQALRIEARNKLVKAQRQVIEEVRNSYASFSETLDTTNLVRTRLLPAQERRRAQTEAAYVAGQTDITALIIAEQELQATRTKLIELSEKTSSALIRLERAVGGAGVMPSADARTPTSNATTRPAGAQ